MKKPLLLSIVSGTLGLLLAFANKIKPSAGNQQSLTTSSSVQTAKTQAFASKPQGHLTSILLHGMANALATLNTAAEHSLDYDLALAELIDSDPWSLFQTHPSPGALAACLALDPERARSLCRELLDARGSFAATNDNVYLWEPLIESDPEAAFARFQKSQGRIEGNYELVEALFRKWGQKDPAAARKAADALSWGQAKWFAQLQAVHGIATKDPQQAIDYFVNLPDDSRATIGLIGVLDSLKKSPAQVALHLLGEQWANYRHNDPLSERLQKLTEAGTDLEKQKAAHSSIYEELGEFRTKMREWSSQDKNAAMEWAKQFPEPEVSKAVQAAMLVGQFKNIPMADAEALYKASDPNYQERMLSDWASDLSPAKDWPQLATVADPSLRVELQKKVLERASGDQKVSLIQSLPQDFPERTELLERAINDAETTTLR